MAKNLSTPVAEKLREFFFNYTAEEAISELNRWLDEANPDDAGLRHLHQMMVNLVKCADEMREN